MKLLAFKHLLQNLPGFKIGVGNSLAAEQGFSGFHGVLSELKSLKKRNVQVPLRLQVIVPFQTITHLSLQWKALTSAVSCFFAVCALEEISQV